MSRFFVVEDRVTVDSSRFLVVKDWEDDRLLPEVMARCWNKVDAEAVVTFYTEQEADE